MDEQVPIQSQHLDLTNLITIRLKQNDMRLFQLMILLNTRLRNPKSCLTKKEKAYLRRHHGMNTFINCQTPEGNQASEGMTRTHCVNFQHHKAP